MSDQPYDPYIPSGGAAGGSQGQPGGPGNQRTAAIQAVGFPFPFTYLVISSTGRTEWFLAPLALCWALVGGGAITSRPRMSGGKVKLFSTTIKLRDLDSLSLIFYFHDPSCSLRFP